jgi:hypothetical protein
MALLQRREPTLIFKYGLSYNNRSPYILDKDNLISQLIERGEDFFRLCGKSDLLDDTH